jgi:anti-sigma28 factor (negative regulator of flagellin synthesis)
MIDRVSLSRLISQALESDRKVRRRDLSEVREVRQEGSVVEISSSVRRALEADYEDLSKKVQRIKEEIAKGTYEVNAEKIIEGFRKFFP